MKKVVLIILTLGPQLLFAQPTIDGTLTDVSYTQVGTFSGNNNGFGSTNNLGYIKMYPSTTDLYIGISSTISSGNRIILFIDFSGYDGTNAGTNIGNFSNGSGNLPNSGNTNVRIGIETDFALEFNNFSNTFYLDANRWGSSGGIGGSYNGSCDGNGNSTTTGTLASTEPWGTTTPNITFAMNNGAGADQGFEIRIPFSSLPGVTTAQSVSFFGIIANNDATVYFSNECIPPALDGTPNYGTNPNITVAGTTSQPLPVELTSFTASVKGNVVTLNWETATEINNYGFEIQRAQIKPNFETIGFVEGHGNSNSPKSYSFTDDLTLSLTHTLTPTLTPTLSYRLKQIDNDGSFEYSNVVEVFIGELPNGFVLEQNYPNPFNPSTKIRFGVDKQTEGTLKVFNTNGEEVAELFSGRLDAGRIYEVEFSANGGSSSDQSFRLVRNLASGVYFYQLQTPELLEVKKMLLVK